MKIKFNALFYKFTKQLTECLPHLAIDYPMHQFQNEPIK